MSALSHLTGPGPKRMLSLDGGDLRDISSLVYLQKVEALLRERHAKRDLLLSDYFDLIAGTSSGAIIAAGLAIGMSVDEMLAEHHTLGNALVESARPDQETLSADHGGTALTGELKRMFGDRYIGDASLRTGLMIVTKNLDTGSAWAISNHRAARYFGARQEDPWGPSRDHPLWQVVHASAVAPSCFRAGRRAAAEQGREHAKIGVFPDDRIHLHSNPALQVLAYATLDGHGLRWPRGDKRLLLLSVGAHRSHTLHRDSSVAIGDADVALRNLIDDCENLNQAMLQWLTNVANPRPDVDISDLSRDGLKGPLAHYIRYQLDDGKPREIAPMQDAPLDPDRLATLSRTLSGQVDPSHFPVTFDLQEPPKHPSMTRFRRREQTDVTAIPLRFEPTGNHGGVLFGYRKWGSDQSTKPGDWLVQNGDDVYTVDAESFALTYSAAGQGRYRKTGGVWAEPAAENGVIQTKEGTTSYDAGDWLVYNREDRKDGYAMSAQRFHDLYEAEPTP